MGVAIAKGMIKGLGGMLGEVGRAAKDLAAGALNKAKSFLGINSPSKEFEKVGLGVGEGFVDGIDKSAVPVNNSAESLANGALDTMKTSMSAVSDILPSMVNTNPVITPVMDLTQFQNDALKMKGMVPNNIAVGTSFDQASTITEPTPFGQVDTSGQTMNAGTTVNFEQNNYSPKALSSVEIYRQTRNQLSLAKEALEV